MNKVKEDTELFKLLSSFLCEQDKDIEDFLHYRAVEFERISKSRTYLVCDQEQLEKINPKGEHLKIYGYISVALKILSVPPNTSNRMRKEIDGFSAKIHQKQISNFPCYLVGQLSKASNVPKDSVSGKQLVEFACVFIATAVEVVGGRYMMVECHDDEKLIHFYEQNSFYVISKIPNENQPTVQMIRKIR